MKAGSEKKIQEVRRGKYMRWLNACLVVDEDDLQAPIDDERDVVVVGEERAPRLGGGLWRGAGPGCELHL